MKDIDIYPKTGRTQLFIENNEVKRLQRILRMFSFHRRHLKVLVKDSLNKNLYTVTNYTYQT